LVTVWADVSGTAVLTNPIIFSILLGSERRPVVRLLVTPDNLVVIPENLLLPKIYLPAIKYKNIVNGIISPSL
jgi:hypothetical protein